VDPDVGLTKDATIGTHDSRVRTDRPCYARPAVCRPGV